MSRNARKLAEVIPFPLMSRKMYTKRLEEARERKLMNLKKVGRDDLAYKMWYSTIVQRKTAEDEASGIYYMGDLVS